MRYRFATVDALETATQSDDAEIASHAEKILDIIRSNWAMPGDPPKVTHLLAEWAAQQLNENGQVYAPNGFNGFVASSTVYTPGSNGSPNSSQFEQLIALPDGIGLPAACRLLRYGPAIIESKQMALAILNLAASGKPPTRIQADQLKQALTGSNRDAARWLLCWSRTVDDPMAMASDWSRCVSDEEHLLARGSDDTSPEIVASLLRLQIAWLRKLDRKQDSITAFSRLIRLEKDKPEVLHNLLSWLIEQEDWGSVETVAQRFGDTIALNSALLYLLAEARAKHGDMQAAEATAQQALKVSPSPDNNSLEQHWYTAWHLQDRGLVEWAARELRFIISASPVPSDLGIKASVSLADLLHEDENDAAAAETLKQLDSTPTSSFDRADSVVVMGDTSGDPLTLGNIRARMNFYSACNAHSKGDRTAERKFLQNALAGNAYDIEVLIAAYHLSDSTPEFKRDISKRIEKMSANLRERIADNANHPASARWCNEFAWLIGNTEGDFDEALTYSKSSIDFMPVGELLRYARSRVFCQGHFAEALKAQTKAVTLLPHNKAIKRQYEMLKKKEAKS